MLPSKWQLANKRYNLKNLKAAEMLLEQVINPLSTFLLTRKIVWHLDGVDL